MATLWRAVAAKLLAIERHQVFKRDPACSDLLPQPDTMLFADLIPIAVGPNDERVAPPGLAVDANVASLGVQIDGDHGCTLFEILGRRYQESREYPSDGSGPLRSDAWFALLCSSSILTATGSATGSLRWMLS